MWPILVQSPVLFIVSWATPALICEHNLWSIWLFKILKKVLLWALSSGDISWMFSTFSFCWIISWWVETFVWLGCSIWRWELGAWIPFLITLRIYNTLKFIAKSYPPTSCLLRNLHQWNNIKLRTELTHNNRFDWYFKKVKVQWMTKVLDF